MERSKRKRCCKAKGCTNAAHHHGLCNRHNAERQAGKYGDVFGRHA